MSTHAKALRTALRYARTYRRRAARLQTAAAYCRMRGISEGEGNLYHAEIARRMASRCYRRAINVLQAEIREMDY